MGPASRTPSSEPAPIRAADPISPVPAPHAPTSPKAYLFFPEHPVSFQGPPTPSLAAAPPYWGSGPRPGGLTAPGHLLTGRPGPGARRHPTRPEALLPSAGREGHGGSSQEEDAFQKAPGGGDFGLEDAGPQVRPGC